MKIAAVAMLAGLMLTVAIIAAVTPKRERPVVTGTTGQAASGEAAELEHCRAAVTPDEACTKVWAARRRRFFGENRTAK